MLYYIKLNYTSQFSWYTTTRVYHSPLSLKKWIFKWLRLPCWWYSKVVPWNTDRSWKGIGLIRSLSTEKTSKTYQNIHIFVCFFNCWKLMIFWHILYVLSVLSDWIKPISFHERSASCCTTLEYHQQGNHSNLKIHFFSLRWGQGKTFRGEKICFGYPEIIGYQMRHWLT